jgi:hypothetical protein
MMGRYRDNFSSNYWLLKNLGTFESKPKWENYPLPLVMYVAVSLFLPLVPFSLLHTRQELSSLGFPVPFSQQRLS